MLTIVKKRLAWQWWRQLFLLLAPVFALNRLEYSSVLEQQVWGLTVFVLSLLSIFASRGCFHRFKHTVIRLGQDSQRFTRTSGWQEYFIVRQKALWVASIPAYCAALGAPFGLETIAKVLLVFCSLLLLWLYRTPRQLWFDNSGR